MFIQINLDKHIQPARIARARCLSAVLPPSYYHRMVAVVQHFVEFRSGVGFHPCPAMVSDRYTSVSMAMRRISVYFSAL